MKTQLERDVENIERNASAFELRLQTKRMDGDWHARWVIEAKVKDHYIGCPWEGFETMETAIGWLSTEIGKYYNG
jgi:hypothetical protein